MQTDKSVPPINKAESPADEIASSADNTVPPPNEFMPPTEETLSPVDETEGTSELTSPTDETTSSSDIQEQINKPVVQEVETPPVINESVAQETKTPPVINESVAQEAKTPSIIEEKQRWRDTAEPWWKATLAVLPTFLVTRFIMLLITYFGGVLFFVSNYANTSFSFHTMLYRWNFWDAKRFTTIANNGYPTKEYAAFFPLYPTLVHVFTSVIHLDTLAASMLISNVAFLGVLIVLYRFVTMEFDTETAKRTVLYISIFPTALFFFAGYNESLFIFFTLFCFYTLRRGSWWLAGLFGLLAALTRSSGIFLALIFVCEYLRQKWPLLKDIWQNKQFSEAGQPLLDLSAVLLIPIGLGIYAYGLYRRFHDPLAFIHAQSNWRQGLTFPLIAPLSTLKKIVTLPFFSFTTAHSIIDLAAAVLFVALLVLCFVGPERIDKSQWPFVLFGLLILVTTMLYPNLPRANGLYDPLASTQRLVLEVFVGFIVLARFGRRAWFHQLYLLISLPMLAFLTLQFMTGHWTV